jgi:hypothetical protein
MAEEGGKCAVGLAPVRPQGKSNGPLYVYAVGAFAAAMAGFLVECLHEGVVGGGGKGVGETPVRPAGGYGIGEPPVRGYLFVRRAGDEGDELDVAAVSEEDKSVWWGLILLEAIEMREAS